MRTYNKKSLALRELKITAFFISFFLFPFSNCQAQAFVTTWKTDNPGSSGINQIRIPGYGSYTIDWEEAGNPANNGTAAGSGTTIVTFPNAGIYQVSITGGLTRIRFNNSADRRKILTIDAWGTISWGSNMSKAFYGCENLTYSATDAPDLSSTTSLEFFFRGCTIFNGNIANWDVSNITLMSQMFAYAPDFNQNIGSWNTSNVTSMNNMFRLATSFNQNIGAWNVSNVTDMAFMFYSPTSGSQFNQDLGSWNTSSLQTMEYMFWYATAYNGSMNNWDVSSVTNLSHTFGRASSFNQPINNWDVSNVTTFESIFNQASSFNQPLNNWNTSSVLTFAAAFENASSFNQYLGDWDMTNLAYISSGFAMLDYSALSINNYDNTLIAWSLQTIPNMTMYLGAEGLLYCVAAPERTNIINNSSWIFYGDATSCPLPIELINLNATLSFGLINITWTTITETNNDHFVVQRSSNGIQWESVGVVQGAGISLSSISYKFVDYSPRHGLAYYRLKQVDFDGSYSLSNQTAVNIEHSGDSIVFFPNPVIDELKLMNLPNNSKIMITDDIGRVTYEGSNTTRIKTDDWQHGIYFMKIFNGNNELLETFKVAK